MVQSFRFPIALTLSLSLSVLTFIECCFFPGRAAPPPPRSVSCSIITSANAFLKGVNDSLVSSNHFCVLSSFCVQITNQHLQTLTERLLRTAHVSSRRKGNNDRQLDNGKVLTKNDVKSLRKHGSKHFFLSIH